MAGAKRNGRDCVIRVFEFNTAFLELQTLRQGNQPALRFSTNQFLSIMIAVHGV